MVKLAIGGIGLHVDGGAGLEVLRHLPGFDVFVDNEAPCDVKLELDAEVELPEAQWLHSFDIVDGQLVCRFGRMADGGYCYDFGRQGWLLCPPMGGEACYRLSPLRRPAVMRFALWAAYSMAGLGCGRLPVHTSVAVAPLRTADGGEARGAVLCLGESGTGKSTHTRLWLEHVAGSFLLNDDSPIVAVEDDEVWVYGSPWSGKTPCFRRERWPVAALLRLEQKPENRIRRLGTIEALTALQPSCPPCLMKDEPLQDALIDFVGRIIERVLAYRLGCLPDAEAARLSHDTIEAQWR